MNPKNTADFKCPNIKPYSLNKVIFFHVIIIKKNFFFFCGKKLFKRADDLFIDFLSKLLIYNP